MADPSSGETSGRNRGERLDHIAAQRKSDQQQRNDRSAWNWLLVPAIVIPLLVPLYNRVEPTLFGWPFFYWAQLAFIALGVATTSLVYQKTKTHKDPDGDRTPRRSGSTDQEGR